MEQKHTNPISLFERHMRTNLIEEIAEAVLDIEDTADLDNVQDGIEKIEEYKEEEYLENNNDLFIPKQIIEEAVEVLEPNDELIIDLSR